MKQISHHIRSSSQIWLVCTISMEFLHLFCRRYFAGKPRVVSWNVGHFLRLYIILPILSILDSTMNQGCPKFGDCVPWGKKATNLFTGNVAMEAEALVHDLRPSNWFSLSYKKKQSHCLQLRGCMYHLNPLGYFIWRVVSHRVVRNYIVIKCL